MKKIILAFAIVFVSVLSVSAVTVNTSCGISVELNASDFNSTADLVLAAQKLDQALCD